MNDTSHYDSMVREAHALASLALSIHDGGHTLSEEERALLDVGVKAGVTGALSYIKDKGWKIIQIGEPECSD